MTTNVVVQGTRIDQLPLATPLAGDEDTLIIQSGVAKRIKSGDLKGKSAYELAQADGFTGSLADYQASLKGQKGDQGIQGLPGVVHILGSLDSSANLPDPTLLNDGDALIIQKHLWVINNHSWVDAGDISGPIGKSAYDLAVERGFAGTIDQWVASLKGADGIGLRIKGSFADTSLLPPSMNESGDAYIINSVMYVWDTTKWSPVGQVGPAGADAYQLAVKNGYAGSLSQWLDSLKGSNAYQLATANGFNGTVADWLASLKGSDGKNVYELAVQDGFIGTLTQWLATLVGPKGDPGQQGIQGEQGPMGPGVTILGKLASTADLPATGTVGDGYLINGNFWGWTGAAYEDLGPIQGPIGNQGIPGLKGDTGADGKNAYEVAVANGFVGTATQWLATLKGQAGDDAYQIALANGFSGTVVQWLNSLVGPTGMSAFELAQQVGFVGTLNDWLASLKGSKGDPGIQGLKGDPGAGLVVKGKVAAVGDLPATAAENDSYVVVTDLYSYISGSWMNLGPFAGPKGDSITPKGSLPTTADLNAVTGATDGDAYIVEGHLYIRSIGLWVDMGDVRGPQGASAFDIAKSVNPSLTDEASFLASLVGQKGDPGPQGASFTPKGSLLTLSDLLAKTGMGQGDTWIVDGGDVYSYDGSAWVHLGNIKGSQGIQGPMGPGISILGKLASTADLPTTGTLGQGYLISVNFWGWTGSQYEDLGPIQGPKGDKGDPGIQGIQGIQGPKGDKGDQGSLWIVLSRDPAAADGRVGDYFINSSTLQFFQKVSTVLWGSMGYMGGGNVYDAPVDGKEYSRYNGVWKILDVTEAPKDGKSYVRINGAWAVNTVTEAPTDGELYLRDGKNQAWAMLDRYTLKLAAATSVLDLSKEQVFTIDASVSRTLSFTNEPPAGRTMMLVLIFTGNAGAITYPANVTWSDGTQPSLAGTITTIALIWTGSGWLGGRGPKN